VLFSRFAPSFQFATRVFGPSWTLTFLRHTPLAAFCDPGPPWLSMLQMIPFKALHSFGICCPCTAKFKFIYVRPVLPLFLCPPQKAVFLKFLAELPHSPRLIRTQICFFFRLAQIPPPGNVSGLSPPIPSSSPFVYFQTSFLN